MSPDPETIRAAMAASRAALARELAQIRSLLFGSSHAANDHEEKKIAQKKEKTNPSHKKTSGARKTTAARGSKKAAGKIKELAADVLAGAAVGAVKGAAEAALADTERTERKGRGRQSAKK